MGVFVKVGKLVAEQGTVWYYLPIIVLAQQIDTSSGRGALILQHELQHLRDILDLVKRDPTYPQRVLKYAMLGPSAYGRVKVINDSVVSKMMAQRASDAIAS
jgi:hypothetical protein